ncbi:MAG: hypothetical protein HY720_16720 [Planctomycetes bacterium]|nr:hypothetical protein [Planctomycetota bacterium]
MNLPARLATLALTLAALLSLPARADHFYRLTRDGKTIGFYQQGEETSGRLGGRAVRVRAGRMAILAAYVGAAELHVLEEKTYTDPGSGEVLGYTLRYKRGSEEETRETRIEGKRATIRIVTPTGRQEERSVDVPEGAFVHADFESVRTMLRAGGRGGKPFPVLDPKSLDSTTGVVEPPGEETLEVRGSLVHCRVHVFKPGSQTLTLWLDDREGEIVRVRQEGAAPVLLDLADESVVEEVQGLDVSAPPLKKIRDLPWDFDHEYRYDFFVEGKPSGHVSFTPTLVTVGEGKRIVVVARIEVEKADRSWRGTAATHYGADLAPTHFEYDGKEIRPDREIETSIRLDFADGEVREVYRKGNQIVEKSQPVPPGCQVLHDNDMEQMAVFFSQVDLERGHVTRVNAYHPQIFAGMLLSIEAGETRREGERFLTTALLSCDAFEAELLLDDRGRLLSFRRGPTEMRLVEE